MASECTVEKPQLSKRNHKEQIHLMGQHLVRAEAQILNNTDVADTLERAVNQVVTSMSLKIQKEKPGEVADLPFVTRCKKIVPQSDASTYLKDSSVTENESCLVEISGVEIALKNTEVLEVNGEKWTTVTPKQKKTPGGCSIQVTTP